MPAIFATKNNALAHAALGALAGAIGVCALDQVSRFLYSRRSNETRIREEKARAPLGGDERGPTSVLVENLSESLRIKLTDGQFSLLVNGIHYALGAIPGAVYGVLLSKNPKMGNGRGFLYGMIVFLVNDEILSVKLNLAAKPSAYPWQTHVRGLLSHLALGSTTYWNYQLLNRYLNRTGSNMNTDTLATKS